MRLYLINHAHAVPRDRVTDTSKRPLSDKGRKDTVNFANFLKKTGETVDRILHVDTSWTLENAELLSKELGGVKVEATAYPLKADDDATPFIDEMNNCSENVALAGPSKVCYQVVGKLLAGRTEPHVAAFANGVCVCLERNDDGTWIMQWMIRPEQL